MADLITKYNTDTLDSIYYGVCIPVRSVIVAATALYPNPMLWGSYGGLAIIGNTHQVVNYTPDSKGAFGQNVWWNNVRYVYILFMIILIIVSLVSPKHMWVIQLISLIFGIIYRSTKIT
jgi:hypothetical protein